MSVMMSEITGISFVYSTLCSGTDERKHQSSTSLAFVRGIHRWPGNSLHKGPVMLKMFPFDDFIMDKSKMVQAIAWQTVAAAISKLFMTSMISHHLLLTRWSLEKSWGNFSITILRVLIWSHPSMSIYLGKQQLLLQILIQCTVEWLHDDVIKWKHFPRHWTFVRGIHRSPVNSPHKCQWHGALMFSFICAGIKCSVNNDEAGDLRHHHTHYDVAVTWLPRRMGSETLHCTVCDSFWEEDLQIHQSGTKPKLVAKILATNKSDLSWMGYQK